VKGEVMVLLECDGCEKREWASVEMHNCAECPEYAAVSASDTWQRVDDCICCSQKCADVIWGDYDRFDVPEF
jgi:hypothetical protein